MYIISMHKDNAKTCLKNFKMNTKECMLFDIAYGCTECSVSAVL